MTNVWGIHMPEAVGLNAVDEGFVMIGWPGLEDIFKYKKDREVFKKALRETYPDKKKGAIPVEAGILYRFVHEMKKGDYVIYPSKHDRQVNIGTFTGETFREPDSDYPNGRKVKWLGTFPRSDFSQAALYEIGSFITIFAVRSSVAEYLSKVSSDPQHSSEPIEQDDDTTTIDVSARTETVTKDYIIRKIHSGLSGHDFENFVAHMMECMGYTARVTPKTGDGGVDVIAHKDELGFEPPIIKVQCKRITSQTGEPEVNQLLGTLGDGEYALYVNLGSYSRAARLLERNRAKLRLINGDEFVDLIFENYHKMSARYRSLIPLKQIYVPDLIEELNQEQGKN